LFLSSFLPSVLPPSLPRSFLPSFRSHALSMSGQAYGTFMHHVKHNLIHFYSKKCFVEITHPKQHKSQWYSSPCGPRGFQLAGSPLHAGARNLRIAPIAAHSDRVLDVLAACTLNIWDLLAHAAH
jgi:hypothetical protein